jgi:hypothetical protein
MIVFCGVVACRDYTPVDFEGVWVISTESREKLSTDFENAAGRMIFDRNGQFVAAEVPSDLLYPDGSYRVSGSGIWKFDPRIDDDIIQLNFTEITIGKQGGLPYGTQLNISRCIGVTDVRLFYFRGDPDSGQRIEFQRDQ